METLDKLDRTILEILQTDGRISNAELAKRIHLSPAATHTRLRRLENDGYITGYGAKVDREKLGYSMVCYINISLQTHGAEELAHFRQKLAEMPEVLECSLLTGQFDYLTKVVVRDQRELEHFILNKLAPLPGVARFSTSLVVAEIKPVSPLPVSIAPADGGNHAS